MKLRVHFGDYASEDKVKFDDLPSTTDVKKVNIKSDENLKTIFSKIKAVIGGLKTVAFSNSYTDLDNKPKSMPADGGTAKTISETLPISKGGTGKETADSAITSLLDSLGAGTVDPIDTDTYLASGKGSDKGSYCRRPLSHLWNYIKSKWDTEYNSKTFLSRGNFNGNIDGLYKSGCYWLPANNYSGTIPSGYSMSNTFAFLIVDSPTGDASCIQRFIPYVGNVQMGDVYERMRVNNVWSSFRAARRGVQNNLTSTSTVDALSANQGKVLKEALDTTKKSVSDGKKDVAAAITAKGVSVTSTDANPATFATLVSKINAITATIAVNGNKVTATIGDTTVTKEDIGTSISGTKTPGTTETTLAAAGTLLYCSGALKVNSLGGDASASNVLTGKTFSSNTAGRAVSGTMPNKGAVSASVNCGGSYTIPAGYHNGSGKVTGNSLSSQITASAVYDKFNLSTKSLATIPREVTSANCIVDGTDYIYLIGGNVGKQATRYNIADNTYSTLASPPENIAYNSAVRIGQYIYCLGESHMLRYNMASNTWYTDTTLSSEVKGGSVILSRNFYIFKSAYVFQYNVINCSGTFSSSPVSVSQSACSSKNTILRQAGLHHSLITSFGESNTIRTTSAYAPSGSTTKATLAGPIFGGVTIIPNYTAILTAVLYANSNYICRLESYTLSMFSTAHAFFTAAVCTVGDDVYVFGSGFESDRYKATILHTEQFLCRHY